MLFVLESSSQSCLPNGIIFRTQSEIDSFLLNYPSCNTILGDVSIFGGSSVTNLFGLNQIQSIEGSLTIDSNQVLTTLEGLNQLSVLGGNLIIGNFPNTANGVLANISALTNLNSVGAQVFIGNNPVLASLSGLEGISVIPEDLIIWQNQSLVNFSGLHNLFSIGGRFDCDENGLNTFTGLENLHQIGGQLKINNNNSLLNLNALYGLNFVGNELIIYHNDTLTSLKGLDSINGSAMTNLVIFENYYLSDCAVQSICNYLTTFGNPCDISFNDDGCKNADQVKEACTLLSEDEKEEHLLSIFPNPAERFTVVNLSNDFQEFPFTIRLYDVFGSELKTIVVKSSLSDHHFDLTMVPEGLYLVIVESQNRIFGREKLIIRKI